MLLWLDSGTDDERCYGGGCSGGVAGLFAHRHGRNAGHFALGHLLGGVGLERQCRVGRKTTKEWSPEVGQVMWPPE